MQKQRVSRKIRYRDLSVQQRSEICNGCGGKGGWVRPPHSDVFIEQCNQHDFNYFLGYLEEHRKKADLQLRKAMHKHIKTLAWYRRVYLHPWCHSYYWAVRWLGKDYFYYGQQEQEVPNI